MLGRLLIMKKGLSLSIGTFAFLATLVTSFAQPVSIAPNVWQTGWVDSPAIFDSSGLVASRNYRGIFWTHNDSEEILFAINRKGTNTGHHIIRDVSLRDWEDIGTDNTGHLYIADIGVDGTNRSTLAVYKIREPNPYITAGMVDVVQRWYPYLPGAAQPDCESFFVLGRFGYVITKDRNVNRKVSIYRFSIVSPHQMVPLKFVTRLELTSDATDADISYDGSRLGIVTEQGVYCFWVFGDIASVGLRRNFAMIRFENDRMKGGAFAGNGFLVSAQSRELLLFKQPPFATW